MSDREGLSDGTKKLWQQGIHLPLDFGDGFTGVYCETCQIVYFKCVWFVVCILYYSKTGSKIMFRAGITKCE